MPSRKLRSKSSVKSKSTPVSTPFRGTLRSEQLRTHLVDRIAAHQIGDKLPGERALAKECGLSLLTVNKVLSVLAAQGLVERRKGLGTFVLSQTPGGATLGNKPMRVLRFVVRNPESLFRPGAQGYSALFYKGVREAAAEDGIETLPTPFEIGADNQEALPANSFGSDAVAGLIFVEQDVPDYRRLWSFLSEEKRIVAFDFAAPESGLNSVLFDNAGGIKLAVDHCVKLGHRRLAYVGPVGNVGLPGDERLNGFHQALSEHNLEPASPPILISPYGANEQIKSALSTTARPTAFVGFMDHYLVPVAHVARELGLRVPEDVSLIGFGDGLRREPYPPFEVDSIAFDEVAMGRTAYALWKSGAKGLVKRHSGKLLTRGSVSRTTP